MLVFQKMKVSIIITVVMALLWTFPDGISLSGCPDQCHCNGKQTRCENSIPKMVPKFVKEVVLTLNNSTQLSPGIFCNISWSNVTDLYIDYSGLENFYLGNYTLMGLHLIQVLKIHTLNRFQAYSYSLCGLENLKVLDLSGCSRLNNQDLVTLLSIKNNTADLKKLILQNTGRMHEGIEFSQTLVDTLASKNICEIDVSYTPVLFSNPNMGGICDTLKTLNLSNSDIDFRSHLDLYQPCKSLRNLDLNAVRIPHSKLYQSWSCMNYHYKVTNGAGQFLKNLDKLNLSRLFSVDKLFYFINCSLTGLGNSYNLKEFQFNGYNIPSLDMVMENIFDQLQAVELSDNRIETIGRNIFKGFKHLMKIDLSKNKLSKNKLFDETFSVLFQNNTKLEEINLSDNGLMYLPPITFTFNRYLKRIDISNNAIRQISFNISRLINLDLLDMRNNSIKHLDEFSRGNLYSLYKMQRRRRNHVKQNTTSTFLIDLRGNPFSCECDSLQFIKWFAVSPIFTATRHLYHCKLNERHIEMNDKAVAAAADDCERPKRKLRKILLSSIISTTVTALLILLLIYMVKEYRRRKKIRGLRTKFHFFMMKSSDSVFQFSCPTQVMIVPLSYRMFLIRLR